MKQTHAISFSPSGTFNPIHLAVRRNNFLNEVRLRLGKIRETHRNIKGSLYVIFRKLASSLFTLAISQYISHA